MGCAAGGVSLPPFSSHPPGESFLVKTGRTASAKGSFPSTSTLLPIPQRAGRCPLQPASEGEFRSAEDSEWVLRPYRSYTRDLATQLGSSSTSPQDQGLLLPERLAWASAVQSGP